MLEEELSNLEKRKEEIINALKLLDEKINETYGSLYDNLKNKII